MREGYSFSNLNKRAILSSWFIVIYKGESIRIETSILIFALSIFVFTSEINIAKYMPTNKPRGNSDLITI
ncbi:MAG: hypothetical protein C0402_13020 [Thermodesulfovibrio sp.]|nr:hypothetical protein [Thermodesulfovibrio sp.]